MARMQSPNRDKTVSFTLAEAKVDALDEIADDRGVSRSEVLREAADRILDEGTSDDDEFVPSDDVLEDVYRQALELSNEKLRLSFSENKGLLAQRTQVDKRGLKAKMARLVVKGYATPYGEAPIVENPRTWYRMKPLCADPEQWVHRRDA